MEIKRITRGIFCFVLVFAMIAIVQPVLAGTETVGIAYQGAGGMYIGDTVVFDGQDLSGNVTILKIKGPDLPADGVPIYDLNGLPGTGNIVSVNPDGSWRLVWYSANVNGVEKLQTARYQFVASDLAHPEDTSVTSIMLKKPEFNVTVTPNPVHFNDYVEITGNTELPMSTIAITVTDQSGTLVHSNLAPVSTSGYFNFNFHVDMQPGQYTITLKNPTMLSFHQVPLTVASLSDQVTATPTPVPVAVPQKGSISIISAPSGASVYLDSVMMGNTPVILGNVSEGTHLVEVKNSGYSTYSVLVAARDGTTVTLNAALVKNSSILSLSPLVGIAAISLIVILARKKE